MKINSIAIGADHAGYEVKQYIINFLKESGYIVIDCGTNNSVDSVDYPVYAKKVCDKIINKEVDAGLLICGSGIGMSIIANRFKTIRAAICYTTDCAKLARLHNNINVLCLGERVTAKEYVLDIVKAFLKTEFAGGHHSKRINLIDNLS